MDEFKKYLQDNRDKLDTENPDDSIWKNVWENIKFRQQQAKRVMINRKLMVAASVLFAVSFSIYYLLRDTTVKNNIAQSPTIINKPILPVSDTIASKKKRETGPPAIFIAQAKKKSAFRKNISSHTYIPVSSATENLVKTRQFYVVQINNKLEDIRSTPIFVDDRNYFNDFLVQYRSLKADEKNIKAALKTTESPSELLQQLTTVYQHQITLLNLLESQIARTNNYSGEKIQAENQPRTWSLTI